MSARLDAAPAFDSDGAILQTMTIASLGDVIPLENTIYPFPWTRGNFVDSLAAGYTAWTLHAEGELIAYCVAMAGVAEMHLLNITVAPEARRRGHARRLLGELVACCRRQQAARLWLEVRESNAVARATYERLAFRQVGVRKGYYPAAGGTREDAVVLTLLIDLEDQHALE